MARKFSLLALPGLALLISLAGCFPLQEAVAIEEPQPAIIIHDLEIKMAIEPPFRDRCPYASLPNHVAEGETVLVYPHAESTIGKGLYYRLAVMRVRDGWMVPQNEIAWDEENKRFIITHPLIGCGCPERCRRPEVRDYEVWLLAYDDKGNKARYMELLHVVPLSYYWP